ncbi:MAG: glycosyltransferase family 2 protein [Desulfobacteraceae bacterium]|nr:glycosyltransferase family 2 protein [Desulfobacteraceae bacterium]
MTMLFSVIIPTFNRRDVLLDCLDHLVRQSIGPASLEVIVCDDGSTDGTMEAINEQANSYPFSLICLSQEGTGPASARNAGIRRAKGHFILFLNDDAQAAPDLLERHLQGLEGIKGESKAVVGCFRFPEDLAVSPFGHILQYTDALFGYSGLQDGTACGYEHFYTCNVSLPRILLEKEAFDPAFKAAAAEDVDLGYRLQKRGVRIHYSAVCRCLHQHRISAAEFCRINRVRGHWAALFFYKHPNLEKRPQLTAKILARWKQEVLEEAGESEKALRHIEAVEKSASGAVLSKHMLSKKAAQILPHVNLLHRHHYRHGLIRSPFVSGIVVKDPTVVRYDIEAERRLMLSPAA